MKYLQRKRPTIAAGLALVLLAFAAWTTNKSNGSRQEFHTMSASAGIIGRAGTPFSPGFTYFSIGELVAGTAATLVYVEGEDLIESPDTIGVGASGFEGNFPQGIDSAFVVVGAGATLGMQISN